MATRNIVLGSLAVGVAGVCLYLALGRGEPKVDLDTYEVLGAVTAEETAKLVGNQGQVLVIARGAGAGRIASVNAEVGAFQRALKKRPGLTVVVERILVNPMMMMGTGGGLPPAQFFKALEAHPNLAAVVLFFGFPQLSEPQLEALKKTGAKVVVVSSLRPGYEQLLERQAIHLAVVPRPDAADTSAPAPAARTVRERFDQDYMLLRPADAPSP
jgi:hypothetical protein